MDYKKLIEPDLKKIATMLEEREIELWSYNLESILGEKLQTILVRERANTRMRDFYDICVLVEMYAKTVIRYVMRCKDDILPKEILLRVERYVAAAGFYTYSISQFPFLTSHHKTGFMRLGRISLIPYRFLAEAHDIIIQGRLLCREK